MSPRAAWRLERFGFDVYDYAAGKVDWFTAGLPTVRAQPGPRRAVEVADRSPQTCSPDTAVAALGPGPVVVVNDEGIVLARVRAGDGADSDQPAEAIMEPGPATVRAHEPPQRHRDDRDHARRRPARRRPTTGTAVTERPDCDSCCDIGSDLLIVDLSDVAS